MFIWAPAKTHTELFSLFLGFYLSVGFWCWTRSSDSQDSTSLRGNDHTNFPLVSPKNAVSPRSGNAKNFTLKTCGQFLSSSWVKMYYFIAKSCARSETHNTSEHFQAGSSTYWRHVLNDSSLTCSRPESVGAPVRIRLLEFLKERFLLHHQLFRAIMLLLLLLVISFIINNTIIIIVVIYPKLLIRP